MSRDVTLRHTGQDVESYLINTLAAAADGLIVTLLISIVAEPRLDSVDFHHHHVCRKYTGV